MVRAGRHDIGVYLDLAAAFARDETPGGAGRPRRPHRRRRRRHRRLPAQRPALQAWVRPRFRPALDAIGLTNGLGDSDDANSRRGTLLQLLSSDPAVQAASPRAGRGLHGQPRVAVAHAGRRRCCRSRPRAAMPRSTISSWRAWPRPRAAPEEYYRFFNALAAFRDPALVTRTLAVCAVAAGAIAGHAAAASRSCSARRRRRTATWDVREGPSGRPSPPRSAPSRACRTSSARSARSARRSAPPRSRRSSRRIRCRKPRGRCSRRSSASTRARRWRRASRRRSRAGSAQPIGLGDYDFSPACIRLICSTVTLTP